MRSEWRRVRAFSDVQNARLNGSRCPVLFTRRAPVLNTTYGVMVGSVWFAYTIRGKVVIRSRAQCEGVYGGRKVAWQKRQKDKIHANYSRAQGKRRETRCVRLSRHGVDTAGWGTTSAKRQVSVGRRSAVQHRRQEGRRRTVVGANAAVHPINPIKPF